MNTIKGFLFFLISTVFFQSICFAASNGIPVNLSVDPPKMVEGVRSYSLDDNTISDELIAERQITVFYLINSHCPVCMDGWATVKTFAEKHSNQVQLFVINNDNPEKVKKIKEKYQLSYQPTVVFFKQGKVIAHMEGDQIKSRSSELLKHSLNQKYKPKFPLFSHTKD